MITVRSLSLRSSSFFLQMAQAVIHAFHERGIHRIVLRIVRIHAVAILRDDVRFSGDRLMHCVMREIHKERALFVLLDEFLRFRREPVAEEFSRRPVRQIRVFVRREIACGLSSCHYSRWPHRIRSAPALPRRGATCQWRPRRSRHRAAPAAESELHAAGSASMRECAASQKAGRGPRSSP